MDIILWKEIDGARTLSYLFLVKCKIYRNPLSKKIFVNFLKKLVSDLQKFVHYGMMMYTPVMYTTKTSSCLLFEENKIKHQKFTLTVWL